MANLPPIVRGVTRSPESDSEGERDPLKMMAQMMAHRPEAADDLTRQAIDLLRQASQADPRRREINGAAIKTLIQGPPPAGGPAGGQVGQSPMMGPSPAPGSIMSLKGPQP